MKKLTIPCDCGGEKVSFTIYVGNPIPGRHPIGQQAAWLARERDCTVPKEVMDALQKLYDISQEEGNSMSFEELVDYALSDAVQKDPDTDSADTDAPDNDSAD